MQNECSTSEFLFNQSDVPNSEPKIVKNNTFAKSEKKTYFHITLLQCKGQFKTIHIQSDANFYHSVGSTFESLKVFSWKLKPIHKTNLFTKYSPLLLELGDSFYCNIFANTIKLKKIVNIMMKLKEFWKIFWSFCQKTGLCIIVFFIYFIF